MSETLNRRRFNVSPAPRKVQSPAAEVAVRRLRTQRLAGEPFASPLDAVGWLGAVQSQDYAGAKWALGQRALDVTDAALDRLFDEGAILRTHVMRPTWHFVLPADIRWLLALTAPRVKATMAYADRRIEIDAALLARSHAVLESALGDRTYLTRAELAAALERAGITAGGQRLSHLVMHAELDALIVSGPRRGRQFTYALLEERAPGARRLDRDEALAELTRRYFTGHGPAQAPDFAWWSGLIMGDVRRGLALAGPTLAHEVIGGRSYWCSPAEPPAVEAGRPLAHLLPNYDELLVAYQDRTAATPPERMAESGPLPAASILANVVVVDGQVRGGWRRRQAARRVVVELEPVDALDAAASAALERSVGELARFLGVPVTLAQPS